MGDWQPGDLALCVRVTHPYFPGSRSTRLNVGSIYTVSQVGRPIAKYQGARGLALSEVQPRRRGRGFLELLFVKITPDKVDEFDREVIDLMLGGKVDA